MLPQVRLLAQQAMDDCMAELPMHTICLPPLLLRCQQADALCGEATTLQVLTFYFFTCLLASCNVSLAPGLR